MFDASCHFTDMTKSARLGSKSWCLNFHSVKAFVPRLWFLLLNYSPSWKVKNNVDKIQKFSIVQKLSPFEDLTKISEINKNCGESDRGNCLNQLLRQNWKCWNDVKQFECLLRWAGKAKVPRQGSKFWVSKFPYRPKLSEPI